MTLISELLGRRLRLTRPQGAGVAVERDLRVPMEDGVVLLADRYAPRDAGPMPTVLVRTPYGRRNMFGVIYGRLYAERGLQVVVQSVRGTFGSGGEFGPFDERVDGLSTIEWIEAQPWHEGKVGMAGMSYLGQVQWAVAADAGDSLGALAPSVASSQFHSPSYSGGLALESALSWHAMIANQEAPMSWMHMLSVPKRLPEVLNHLPLGQLDQKLMGKTDPLFQRAFEYTALEDPYWARRDFSRRVGDIEAPVQLVAGWFDMFTPWQIEDFVALRRAGKEAQLIVGPWAHTSEGLLAASTRESIAWLRGHLLGDIQRVAEAPVRVHVGGRNEWVRFDDWPPPGAQELRLHLQPGGALGEEEATASEPDTYRYDPSDPTPSLGGPVLLNTDPVVDNAPLESRGDVLTFTTRRLEAPVEAIGPVRAEIHFRSSLEYFDVFVRVCDVDRWGVSRNVCDALERVMPGHAPTDDDGVMKIAVSLWPTAHRFAPGHRIRVQVSSGAHPRYARNLGTGEPLGTATRMLIAKQEVFHDAGHPSAVILTVVEP